MRPALRLSNPVRAPNPQPGSRLRIGVRVGLDPAALCAVIPWLDHLISHTRTFTDVAAYAYGSNWPVAGTTADRLDGRLLGNTGRQRDAAER